MAENLPPLTAALENYLARNPARLHMPGHKGRAIFPVGDAARYDITEVAGCDSLFEADGPIAATEARYRALYGTAGALLSAGGSTLCIQTMLALAARPGDTVICGRGVHTAAVNAMALLDLHPVWISAAMDAATGLPAPVPPERVAEALARHPEAAAVYLTSPNYFGTLCDIAAIAAICGRVGVPLLVDNAHGAHLRFLRPDLHPITRGAALCCDSAHKTLPVLTGGALLQVGDPRYLPDAKRKMSLFGSTSPSYLTLLSLDGALPWLENSAPAAFARLADRVAALEELALAHGFQLPPAPRDPVRLALGFEPLGLSAAGFRAHLERCGVEPEYLAETFCVFLPGPANDDRDFARLEAAIRTAPRGGGSPSPAATLPGSLPERAVSVREAVLAPTEALPPEQAVGRVCGGMVSPCPPGIPLAIPGERLDKNLCDLLKKYGILTVNVLK